MSAVVAQLAHQRRHARARLNSVAAAGADGSVESSDNNSGQIDDAAAGRVGVAARLLQARLTKAAARRETAERRSRTMVARAAMMRMAAEADQTAAAAVGGDGGGGDDDDAAAATAGTDGDDDDSCVLMTAALVRWRWLLVRL